MINDSVLKAINDADKAMQSVVGIGSSATGSDLIISDAGASYAAQTLTAKTVTVSAANAADTAAGTGARTILLSGYDASYNKISEIIALNGQTGVNSVNSYLFVDEIEVLTAGSGGTNAGIIYAGTGTVTTGVPATQWLQIVAAAGVSRAALFVVPAGYTAIIKNFVLSNGTATNACTVKLWTQGLGGPWVRRSQVTIPALVTQIMTDTFVIPEKTVVRVTGNNVTSTSTITSVLNYYLTKR